MTWRILAVLAIAGSSFAQSADQKAWDALKEGVDDTNPAKRIAAVIAMSVVKPQPAAVKMVEAKLDDKDFGVRQAACATLGDMRSRSSIPALKRSLDDKAPEVIFAAAKALYAMRDPAGADVLAQVLEGEQKDASGFVTTSLRDAKLKLHDPKAMILLGVNQAAGFLGPAGAGVPIAEQLMKDGQASGKTVAALLLATDTSPASKQAIKSALDDKNWTVRAAAARAVALRGLREFYPETAALLDDKRDEVRYSAAAAMIRLRQAVPVRRTAPEPAKK